MPPARRAAFESRAAVESRSGAAAAFQARPGGWASKRVTPAGARGRQRDAKLQAAVGATDDEDQ